MVFGVVSGWYPVVSGGILAHLRPKSVETKGYPTATSKCFIILEGEQGTPGGEEKRGEDGRCRAELPVAPYPSNRHEIL